LIFDQKNVSRSKQANSILLESFDMYLLVFVVRFVTKSPGASHPSSTLWKTELLWITSDTW